MAASKSILDALFTVSDAILEAEIITKTFSDLNGGSIGSPQWPFAMERMIERIKVRAEELETLVRQKAIPLMTDVEAANQHR